MVHSVKRVMCVTVTPHLPGRGGGAPSRTSRAAASSTRVAGPAHWRTRILPPTDGRGGWAATLVVGLLAGLLRVVRLDLPAGRIFDEIYYV